PLNPPSEPAPVVESRRVTVLEIRSGGWIRVEYERKPGSEAAPPEKGQLWLNFAHVSTISEIAATPEDKPK
nr:hypothetical protein [Verrucomicrobiota bacterium]